MAFAIPICSLLETTGVSVLILQFRTEIVVRVTNVVEVANSKLAIWLELVAW
jgi:hypothetical protein